MSNGWYVAMVTLVWASLGTRCHAQMPAPSPASFEVASVRMVEPYSQSQIESGLGNHPLGPFPSNRFTGCHVAMQFLIALAFAVDSGHVIGGDVLRDAQLYDIEAKVAGDQALTLDQMRPLLQELLRQRFGLAVHTEE